MICEDAGKIIHNSKQKAHQHVWHLNETQGKYEGRPYRCTFCRGWHVGRAKENAHKNKYIKLN